MVKFLIKLACGIMSVFVLIACGGGNTNARPEWIDNPGNDHVGKCGTHVKGLIYQEQCAYKKGLTYIALTKGVTADVSADMSVTQRSGGTGTSKGNLNASIKMEGKEIKIKGKVIEKWHDQIQDIFYVLIREE